MSVDLAWQSQGGLLLDGTGDLAFTANPIQCLKDMVDTRLKAALNGWKLYPGICAGLDQVIGRTNPAEINITLQRQVYAVLSNGFLPTGSFQIRVVPAGRTTHLFVFLGKNLLTSYTVTA